MKSIKNTDKKRLRIIFSVLFLLFFTVLIYCNSLNNSFMWDDHKLISQDRFIKDLKYIPYLFSLGYNNRPYVIVKNEYRPVTEVSFALDYRLWKNDPKGYHLTNIILHTLNTIVFFLLFLTILVKYFRARNICSNDDDSKILVIALIGALFFASQPVITETVNWIKNRSELLSTFFCLLSLFTFLRSISYNQKSKSYSSYSMSICFFILSLLSKESGISLPLVLACSMFFLSTRYTLKKIAIRTGPFFLIALLFLISKYTLFNNSSVIPDTSSSISLYTRLLIIFKSFWEYLHILIYPFTLNAERIFLIPSSILSKGVIPGILAISLLFLVIVKSFKNNRLLSFVLTWLFLTLLAISNIIFLESRPIAEQRLYFICIPFCMFLPLFLYHVSSIGLSIQQKQKYLLPFIIVLGIMISLIYTSSAIKRSSIWKDPFVFWREALKTSPLSSRANNNMGNAYYSRGDYTTAARYHKIAMTVDPANAQAYSNFGIALARLGRKKDALNLLLQAININPKDAETYNNLGITYSSMGDTDKAIESYKKAISLNPDLSRSYHNLGALYAMAKESDEALRYINKSLEIDPYYAGTYNNLGNLYVLNDQKEKAAESYIKALSCNPGYYNSILNLSRLFADKGYMLESAFSFSVAQDLFLRAQASGKDTGNDNFTYLSEFTPIPSVKSANSDTYIIIADAYKMIGQEKKAKAYYLKAFKFNPKDTTACNRLGILYASEGKSNKAMKFFLKAIASDPGKAESYNNAGIALYMAKDRKAAIDMFSQAIALDPSNPTAASNLYHLFIAEGKNEKADQIMQRAIKSNTTSTVLYETLISSLMDSGNTSKVIETYEVIPKNIVLSSITYNNIGIAYGSIGKTDEALDLFIRSVNADNNNIEALYNLALTYMDTGAFEDSYKTFHKALELDSENTKIINSLAFLCYKTKKYNESEDLYKKVLLAKPDDLNVINSLGILYASTGKQAKAEDLFLKILDTDPKNIGAYYNLGNIYFFRKETQKAINSFTKVTAIEPTYGPAYIKLAILYLSLDDKEKAGYYYTKAKNAGISDPAIEKELKQQRETDE